jgi:K+-sensing histidine kinase KdpD
MQESADLVLRLKPWSPPAFLAALLAIALGSVLEKILLSVGITLYFAGFVPAILIASLFAGVPAGLFATVAAIPLVWWAFMPPHFEFSPLTAADYHRFVMFALLSALAIRFSQLCREARSLSRK